MAKYSTPMEALIENSKGKASSLKTIESCEMVPGDIVKVPEGKVLPCDLILLTGTVIINEAMLTGESIPVMKSCLPVTNNETYRSEEHSKHTLYGGTHVI